jgi:hypothetical protein
MKKTYIQSLIFSKKGFKTKFKVKKWIIDNKFKFLNKRDGIKETNNNFRVRQINPSRFNNKTFRTINIDNNIKAVIAKLK